MTDLNFIPKNRDGKPHIIDYTCAVFIATQLDARISKDNPTLEARIANELFQTGTCNLTIEEVGYLKNNIQNMDIDNLLKGQILEVVK